MMPLPLSSLVRRGFLPCSVITLSLLTVSCKLPPREAWNKVQQHGLLPVLFEHDTSTTPPARPPQVFAQASTKPALEEAAPLRVQAVQQPRIARLAFATPVPGRSGYVFSPHATERVVDVRGYAAGAEVRCPYTMQPFQVPDFSSLAPPVPQPGPARSIGEVVSRTPGLLSVDPIVQDPLPTPEPEPVPPPDPALPEIPYGTRIPGRPGFVYSPFAGVNQLVDVAGIAPGVEVKCPYSNQLFRVPEPLPEEMPPAPGAILPPAPPTPPVPENTPDEATPPPVPAPAPETPPSPAAPELPTAAWADPEKNQVQSPFGTPGQLIDVSGRAAGSTMPCPFTNKEFIIPAR